MRQKILEKYIRSVLKELSSPVAKLLDSHFACSFIKGEDDYYTATIYDPQALAKAINKFDSVKDLSDYFIADYEKKSGETIMIASVDFCKPDESTIGKSWDAFEVATSASNQDLKLGPVAYDIAMYYASKLGGGLMSDRKTVSPKARSVWKNYMSNRDGIEKKELDDKKNPKTAPKIDDSKLQNSEELNFVYNMNEKPPGLDHLEKNHKLFLQLWKERNGSSDGLDVLLIRGGDMLFNNVY
jgi:hypothetical protein